MSMPADDHARALLQEFVRDIETAYANPAEAMTADGDDLTYWPDLYITYSKAKAFLRSVT